MTGCFPRWRTQLAAIAAARSSGIHCAGGAREVVRSTAPNLPRGTYLVRLEPGAAALAPSVFRDDVAAALLKAGRERVPA